MRSVAKLVLVVLVAVMCVDASAATSASAAGPLFINESEKALLFTSDGGAGTLRGKRASGEGTIKCEKSSGHGFTLDKSPLAREIHLEFSGKCEQEVLGSKGTCTEPIKPVLSYGELGLLNGHVLLLVAPEGTGTKFVSVSCTNGNTEVEGAVIGEFKLKGRDGNSQYNLVRTDFLLLFNAKGTTQEPEEIELLGSLMKSVALKVEGFLGEKASEETVQLLLSDGPALISNGEEQTISSTSTGVEEAGSLIGNNGNPFELLAIIIGIIRHAGTGTITGGTCVRFRLYASLAKCTVNQKEPYGNLVIWLAL